MTWLEAVVLGIVQGLTELLPVSSSGHLALVPAFLGWDQPALGFTIAVHVGTVVAVCVYFRNDLKAIFRGTWCLLRGRAGAEEEMEEARAQAALGGLLLLGSAPAAVAGVLLEETVEASFGSIERVGVFLIVTACLLWVAERLSRRRQGRTVAGWKDAVVVGLGQASALFPGISRSGATISVGMAMGLAPTAAVRFAFLLSIPIILGGGAWEGFRAAQTNLPFDQLGRYALGAAVAAVSAWGAIALVYQAVRRGRFSWFAIYCAAVGVTALVFGLAGHSSA